jgi:hypothetical protein
VLTGDKISSQRQTLQLGFDFAERSWPAHEPEPCKPHQQSPLTEKAAARWNMSAQKPRISAVYERVPSIIENPERLRVKRETLLRLKTKAVTRA